MKKTTIYWEELKQGPIHNTASFNLCDSYKIIKMGRAGEICPKPQTNQQKLWAPHQVVQPKQSPTFLGHKAALRHILHEMRTQSSEQEEKMSKMDCLKKKMGQNNDTKYSTPSG